MGDQAHERLTAMLILGKGVTRESIGRLSVIIDQRSKTATLTARGGAALDESDYSIMRKYLAYHHPEIINPHGIATGWSIVGELEVSEQENDDAETLRTHP